MALVIKKPVDLSSLGDEYKGISLIFHSIPARKLVEIEAEREKLVKDEKGDPKLEQIIPFFTKVLQENFISGKQNDNELTKEDIAEMDENSLIHCFQILTGQIIDPKVQNSSPSPSKTDMPA